MKTSRSLQAAIVLCVASAGLTQHGVAQPPSSYPVSAAVVLLTAAELQDLVGRFALYPDDLIALILPASTTPLEIVKAQRFLTKYAADKSLKPDPSLSEPVMNLLTYPDVVNLLGDDLDWTQNLGQAVTDQQVDVLSAIQIFRRKAQSAGNLKTDDKLTIVVKENIVQIVPTQPEVIYVPQYQPASVVVVQSSPAIVYAPTAYPVYYHPGAAIATAAAIGYIAGAHHAYGCNWYGGGIYVAPRVAHYGHIQDERMDYANNAREDWQDYGKANREDWQNHANNAQSKRQDAASSNQGQRQDAIRDPTSANQGQRQDAIAGGRDRRTANQGQRQDSVSGAQDKRGANQGQRQKAAQENQGQRQSAAQNRPSSGNTPQGGQNWQPSAQTRPTTGSKSGAATANRPSGEASRPKQQPASTQFGTKQSSRSSAGAYGGASSGARAQTQSARGERSMSGASRSGGGGNRGGGGGGGRSRGR